MNKEQLKMARDIKRIKSKFTPVKRNLLKDVQEESFNTRNELQKERIKEIRLKNNLKKGFAAFFTMLLLIQNISVFGLLYWALMTNQLDRLGIIFATLVSATLLETYAIAKVIVNWMYKDTDYTV